MIVKLRSDELTGRLMADGKRIITMTEIYNVDELKQLISTARFVYSDILLYKGDIDSLLSLVLTPEQKSRIMVYQTINPDLYNIDVLSKLSGYTVLGMTASDYHNMEQLYKLNAIYPNIRFCGGHFCKLDGVNIGLIEDKSKEVVFNNEYSISDEVVTLSDLDNDGVEYEFVAKAIKASKDKQSSNEKVSKPKAKVSSVPKYAVIGSMDCF